MDTCQETMAVPHESIIQAELLRSYPTFKYSVFDHEGDKDGKIMTTEINKHDHHGEATSPIGIPNTDASLPAEIEEQVEVRHGTEQQGAAHLPQRSVLQRVRAWSWPAERGRQCDLPTLKKLEPALEPALEPHVSQGAKVLWTFTRIVLWSAFAICVAVYTNYMYAGALRYARAPDPAILGGWSKACPANWIYGDCPTMALLGYQLRYEDVRPPWSTVRSAYMAEQRCWHGDKNLWHQDNKLNVSFPVGNWKHGGTNYNILRRLAYSYDVLTLRDPELKTRGKHEAATDGLPLCNSKCACRCRLRDALTTFLASTLNPMFSVTARYPQTVDDLPQFCPCSFRIAWISLRQTFRYLPKPRSIHPFYVDRKTSSLYKHWDPFSWFVWLWGNEFFVLWRRTSIYDVDEAEMRELYIEGHWYWTMSAWHIHFPRETREARGVALTKRELAAFEEICRGDEECFNSMLNFE